MRISVDPEECFFGEYPTLADLKAAYGHNAPQAWLIPQLYNLSEYCGVKEKLQGNPLKECAYIIAINYYYLKVSEIMLFFARFKSARYGRFYGNVDPLIIASALKEFVYERIAAIEQRRHEIQEREREESRKNACSWEEYLAMKKSEQDKISKQ